MTGRAPVTRPRRRRPGAARPGTVAAAAVAALLVGACDNPFSPEASEAGVYKGASDPLLQGSAEERAAALRERFELIQRRGAAGPVAESGTEDEADEEADGDTG